jgi:hypothetical protein
MLAKYEPTISQEHKATWHYIIRKKVKQRANDWIYAPLFILKPISQPEVDRSTDVISVPKWDDSNNVKSRRLVQSQIHVTLVLPKRTLTSIQKTKRDQEKKRRKRAVQAGTKEGTHLFPGPPSCKPFIPHFLQQEWRQTYDTGFPDAA